MPGRFSQRGGGRLAPTQCWVKSLCGRAAQELLHDVGLILVEEEFKYNILPCPTDGHQLDSLLLRRDTH